MRYLANKWTPLIAAAAALIVMAVLVATGARAQETVKWSACGVYGGVGMAASKTEAGVSIAGTQLVGIDGLGTSGAAFTLGVGCDYQLADRFVLGVFGDWTKHDQSFEITSIVGSLAKLDLQNQWSVGGRAGVLIHPTTLVYGLVAYTELATSDINSPLLTIAMPDLKGWQIGGGIETAIGKGVFLAAEYRFTTLDTANITIGPANLGLDTEMHTAMAKLSYRFGFDK